MALVKYTRNKDNTYGPTLTGDYYISKEDHRRTAKKKFKKGVIIKARWAIEEGQEFGVFKDANEKYAICFCIINNCLFGLVEGGDLVIGQEGERIAKFPGTNNNKDPWHGYPVDAIDSQNRPTSEMLDIWTEQKRISLATRLKIERSHL